LFVIVVAVPGCEDGIAVNGVLAVDVMNWGPRGRTLFGVTRTRLYM